MRTGKETKETKKVSWNDTRIRTGFLFFPKTIKGVTRWLETATWEQRVEACFGFVSMFEFEWVDTRWLD